MHSPSGKSRKIIFNFFLGIISSEEMLTGVNQ
jgi:hypothetical protein